MKVLFITGSLNQGGAEFQLLAHAKLFQEKGNEVEVLALTDYSFYKSYVDNNNLIYSHFRNDQSKIKRVFLTAKKIREYKPDLIISYLKAVSQVAIVARILSAYNAELIVAERTSLIRATHDKYYFNLIRLSDSISVNSLSKLNYIKENFPFLKNKIHFFPNVVDVCEYPMRNTKVARDPKRLVYVGRIAREKNVEVLVHAVHQVLAQGYEIELELYGDSRDTSYLERVQSAIGEEIRIKMMGKTDNVSNVYLKADLLCLLSDYEGFSNVLSEALCHGLPVITSKIEENQFLIEHCANGYLVNPRKPESVAKGIIAFLNLSLKQVEAMSTNNRRKAEKIFDRDALYQKYCQILIKNKESNTQFK
jgi:glycosyltransferase involved in cell wall biosynthesis